MISVSTDLLELGTAAEVLRLEFLVAEHFGIGDHLDELVCGHGLPELVEEGAVVDAYCWGDDCAETLPVLSDRSVWWA